MYLYDMADIKEGILEIIADAEYSLDDLRDNLTAFFDYTGSYKDVIGDIVASEVDYSGTGKQFLEYLYEIFASTEMTDSEKRNVLTPWMRVLAESSDDEDLCEGKIYVVIDGINIVKEDHSWDEAEKDVDEWYTGCCDDLYIAENVLFPILCAVQAREWDECLNFCIVMKFDATDIEDGRAYWEEANCE